MQGTKGRTKRHRPRGESADGREAITGAGFEVPALPPKSFSGNLPEQELDMADRGLQGIDETVQQTYVWIDEVADAFHGSRHEGFQVLRGFLHTLRDHLPTDESAQLAAQLPMLVRGVYYEGWNPGHSTQRERGEAEFLRHMVSETGIREFDARDAVKAAWGTMAHHITGGELAQVEQSLPKHVRALLV
jgi:uncharacterized protein (DUF2267 family)